MPSHRAVAWLKGVALATVTLVALGGCFLMGKWHPGRPDPTQISGPPVYVPDCQTCHGAPVGEAYAQSRHSAMGIRCGQCHTPEGHPSFTEPVQDSTCGGCHQPAFEQTLKSAHFVDRQLRPLDGDQAARVTLRHEGFIANTPGGKRFVGDAASGTQGGRLCFACHYDEHRLGLQAVQKPQFCDACHVGYEQHFNRQQSAGDVNRCTRCHVRAGTTDSGQVVNTHQFAKPVRERPSS